MIALCGANQGNSITVAALKFLRMCTGTSGRLLGAEERITNDGALHKFIYDSRLKTFSQDTHLMYLWFADFNMIV